MAYGTFFADGRRRPEAVNVLMSMAAVALVFALTAIAAFATVPPSPVETLQKMNQQRFQQLSGFTQQMQGEADKAIRLCTVGLLGEGQHCAKHVVSTDDSKWTHTETGANVWEENQRFLPVQTSVLPQGPEIGTPGDFGDRR
eukprot:CAMPEP_0181319224 /NCGR_PEP_ID=MMETSP1101-20121128/17452_1 /TAXON_ID=46948 /ORGANISM="Rhodomonas abbreviata, Strain Caron Lab Isolate" /LENGTH=141 /DNA_ID=CAMNT_0023426799 /DNA_START=12 /DNA_END=437 /DNA_ORIENTATION=-